MNIIRKGLGALVWGSIKLIVIQLIDICKCSSKLKRLYDYFWKRLDAI
jgi:hypothetical protein